VTELEGQADASEQADAIAVLAPHRAVVIGAGLMGGSVALALRALGWHVSGIDQDRSRIQRGIDLGAFDAEGPDDDASVTFVCTPVSSVPELAKAALAGGGIVTDIGSTKHRVVASVDDPRFVGGHPMCGSEQDGIEAADGAMFNGRTWVLTPTDRTDPDAYARIHALVSSFGAVVMSVSPDHHDELVAVVSHVPHLAAATLMSVAAERSEEHGTLLRLAAGGFRDMTRIAAGHPSIWLDICEDNRDAIVTAMDRLIADLRSMRDVVESGDRPGLNKLLTDARVARINLPTGAPAVDELVELRVPIPDRPGFIAEVSRLASDLGVNIYDIELSHSIDAADRGMLVLVVAKALVDLLRGGLLARGFKPSVSSLGER
jgi:prephenate dehydrogenase